MDSVASDTLKSLFIHRTFVGVDLNLNDGLTLEQRKQKDERYIRNFIFGDSVYKIHRLYELCLADESINGDVKELVNELYCEFVDGDVDG